MPHVYDRHARGPRSASALVLALAATHAAWAQLDGNDLAALRAAARREGWTFTVASNPATAQSQAELCGLREPPDWRLGATYDNASALRDLPAAFDWRQETGCPPVRNQGGCGSCWAFATVGALECNILIRDGQTVDLSEQWLVSCNQSGYSCGHGGWFAHEYHRSATDPCGQTGAVLEARTRARMPGRLMGSAGSPRS